MYFEESEKTVSQITFCFCGLDKDCWLWEGGKSHYLMYSVQTNGICVTWELVQMQILIQ